MAFMIKEIIDLKGILFLMLLTVMSEATNLDCYGKAFHCVNSTHFMICVDLGRGTSTTIDDVIIPCPSPTVCRRTNRFECEFPPPSIPSSTVATTELTTTVNSEITTFVPMSSSSIPFEEYFDTVSTTTISQTEPPFTADTILSVKPIADTSGLTTTEVNTEKYILSGKNVTTESVVEGSFNSDPSDISVINVNVSNDTSNLNVLTNDVTSENNYFMSQTVLTESSELNTESGNLGKVTPNHVTSTVSTRLGNTENVLITSLSSTVEDMTETVTVSAITEVTEALASTDISNVSEKTVATQQDHSTTFQNDSHVDNSTLLDAILLDRSQNIKEMNGSGTIITSKENDVLVITSSNDSTSTVLNKVVNSEPNSSIIYQNEKNAERTTISDFLIPSHATTSVKFSEGANVNISLPVIYTTKQDHSKNVSQVSILDISKSLDVILLEPTPNIKENNEPQYLSTNKVNKMLGSTSTDVTTDMTEKIVNTEPDFSNVYQEVTESTTTDFSMLSDTTSNVYHEVTERTSTTDFSILSYTTTPVKSNQNAKVNLSQPVTDTTSYKTVNFSDLNMTQTTASNAITITEGQLNTHMTESSLLKTTSDSKLVLVKTSSKPTANTEVFTTDFVEPSLNVTETINNNTESPVYKILTDFTAPKETTMNDPDSIHSLPSKVTMSENFKIISVTPSTQEHAQTDRIKASKPIDQIAHSGLSGNVSKDTVSNDITNTSEFETSVTYSPVVPTMVDTNTVSFTYEPIYQEPSETTTTNSNILNFSEFDTEQSTIIIQLSRTTIVDLINKTDAVTAKGAKAYDLSNSSVNQNDINNTGIEVNQNYTTSEKGNNYPNENVTEYYKVPEFVTELQFTSSKNFNDVYITSEKNDSEEHLETKVLTSGHVNNVTTEPNFLTETLTSIVIDNSELLATTSTVKPILIMATENATKETITSTNDPQTIAENIDYKRFDIVKNVSNENVLLTEDADNQSSIQAYKLDSYSQYETTIQDILFNKFAETTENGLHTESVIFSSAKKLPELAITINDIDETHSETNTVSYNNSNVSITNTEKLRVKDPSATPISFVAESSYVDSSSYVKEHTDKAISLDLTKVSDSSKGSFNRNNTLSLQVVERLPQTDTITLDITTSLLSTTTEIPKATPISSNYITTGIANNLEKSSTAYNIKDQTVTETNTLTQSAHSNTVSLADINESIVTNKRLINAMGSAHSNQESNYYETAIKEFNNAAHTVSVIPPTTGPALVRITSIVSQMIPTDTTKDSNAKPDEINSNFVSSQGAIRIESLITVQDSLSDSNLTDLSQNNIDRDFAATKGITASDMSTEVINTSHNFNSYLQSSTDKTPDIIGIIINSTSNNDSENETMTSDLVTESYIEKIKNTFVKPSLVPLDINKINQDASLATINKYTDLKTKSLISRKYETTAPVDIIMRLTNNVPELDNTATLNVKKVNDRSSTETYREKSFAFTLPDLATTVQKTEAFSTNTPIDPTIFASAPATVSKTFPTKIPQTTITDNTQRSTINADKVNERLTDVHLNIVNTALQTNPVKNITFNSSIIANIQKPIVPSGIYDSHLTVVNVEERIEETSTNYLTTDNNTTSSVFNKESPYQSAAEIKSNSEVRFGDLVTSVLSKEDKHYMNNDSRTEIFNHLSVTARSNTENVSLHITSNNNNINPQTSVKLIPLTINPQHQHDSKTNKISIVSRNQNTSNMHSILPATDKTLDSIPQSETARTNTTATNHTLNSVITLPVYSNVSLKQNETMLFDNTTVSLSAGSVEPVHAVDSNTIIKPYVDQNNSEVNFINSNRTPASLVINVPESDINLPSDTSLDIDLQYAPHTEPIGQDINYIPAGNSQGFINNRNTKVQNTTAGTGHVKETLIKEVYTKHENTNSGFLNSENDQEIRTQSTYTIIVEQTTTSIDAKPFVDSPDLSVPTEVITTSDVLVDDIESHKTHSGIVSLITPLKTHDEKEKPEEKETEGEERNDRPINVELVSLQDQYVSKPSTPILILTDSLTNTTDKIQNDIGTREEVTTKPENSENKNNNGNSRQPILPGKSASNNNHNDTNTAVNEHKKETPTYELFENSTPSSNDIRTLSSKSQDPNIRISQARNTSVILNDQSITPRYMPLTESAAATDALTTRYPASEPTTRKNELNKFSCKQKKRGRYADVLDCRKFYICIGNKSSNIIEGSCPINTVFSEINKQCTKNLSHCIRNNQFRCVTEGRFSDFLNDNVYYICVRNNLSQFIRFKLLCQNGYHLNKTSVRCDLNTEPISASESRSVSEQSSSSIKQDIKMKPEKFKCKKEGLFPDSSSCKKYFECTKVDESYRQKKKKCDSDEIFHKDKKKCVDADSYAEGW